MVYGHTPVPEPEWLNKTINVDTGCVFGGKLTALRWPELKLVSVPALQVYAEPARPFLYLATGVSAQQEDDAMLDMEDVSGKRFIETRLERNVLIREENSIAALEVMSRFAADPRWLIYLPPTMSPSETTRRDGLLEHPDEAFHYYGSRGIRQVICQEKHMGSRALVVVCLDCELMPWSAKAQKLLSRQYAPVGTTAHVSLTATNQALHHGDAAAAIYLNLNTTEI